MNEMGESSSVDLDPRRSKKNDNKCDLEVKPPDGGYGWVILCASFFANMIVDGLFATFVPLVDILALELEEERASVVVVVSLQIGIYHCLCPIVSAFVSRVGCRPVCIVGGVISTVGLVLSTYSKSLLALILTEGVITGVGLGFVYLPTVICIGEYFDSKRPLAFGILASASSIGPMVFAPFMKFLVDAYGWEGANLLIAGIALNCSVSGTLLRPLKYMVKKPKSYNREEENCISHNGNQTDKCDSSLQIEKNILCNLHGCEGPKKGLLSFKIENYFAFLIKLLGLELFKKRTFLLLVTATTLSYTVYYSMYTFLPSAATHHGIDRDSAILLASIVAGSSTFGRLALGAIATWRRVNPILLFSFSELLAGFFLFLGSWVDSYPGFVVVAVGFGFFQASLVTLNQTVLVECFGIEKLQNSYGFAIFFAGISVLGGAPTLELLSKSGNNPDFSFYFGGLLLLCSGLLLSSVFHFEKKKYKH